MKETTKTTIAISVLFIVFILLMVGVVFAGIHGKWLQDNCKWEDNYGTVRSMFYDSGWANHLVSLNLLTMMVWIMI